MILTLVLVAVALLALFGWIAIGGVAKIGRDQNRAEQNAEGILNAAFDGRPDVTFELNLRTLKPETVVAGARKRGYKLVHQADNMYGPTAMVFEKV